MQRLTKTALALTVLATAVIAGCSKKDDTSGSAGASAAPSTSASAAPVSTAPKKDVTIEYWTTPAYKNVEGSIPNPNFGDWEQAKINEYQKSHPNVKINFQLVASDAIEQKMTVALAGNNPPDILLDALDRRLMKYVKFGKNEPMDDFIEKDKADYSKELLSIASKDGKLYGIPLTVNAEYMFINKKIFQDKGLESLIPKDRDWNFDEWKDAIRKVNGGGVYGTTMFAGNEQADEMFLMYLYGMGVEQWNADSTEVTMGKYKEAGDTIQLFKDLTKEGVVAPGPATLKATDALELFKQGKIAMMPWAQSLYSLVDAGQKDGSVSKNIDLYGILPVHKDGVTPKIPVAVAGYTVFKQTDKDKREAIKEFLQYMTTSENVKLLAKSGSFIPSRTSSTYPAPYADMAEINKLVSALPSANLGKTSPMYAEVRALWFPALQAALLDKMTPQQAVEDYTAKANKLLASAPK
ncbi:MAG: sugar ABC transporter substrate-binding protein [Paenibacillaceae bacterium]|nr:sugar ABC transporter substrate-binding protein [Paenibacillaceae bacterium]